MFSIAIYSDKTEDVEFLKSIIQDYLIEIKAMSKISYFNDPETFITTPGSYDVYIMDMDSETNVLELGTKKRHVDVGKHFVYISSDPKTAILATKARADYYALKPIEIEEFREILKEIKAQIKDDSIIIKIASGERRVRINSLNYIDIEKRCLCYHLSDGTMFDGQTLRSSFEKAITPLNLNKSFLFLAPSLLINISAIKILNKDNIIFENDDVLYFPAKQYDKVRETWHNFNRIID